MDSTESRWVFQEEEEEEEEDLSEIGNDEDDDGNEEAEGLLTPRNSMMGSDDDDDDDNDNAEQRLIRTGPRIDSFDVEALEVPGAQRNDFEVFIAKYVDLIFIWLLFFKILQLQCLAICFYYALSIVHLLLLNL